MVGMVLAYIVGLLLKVAGGQLSVASGQWPMDIAKRTGKKHEDTKATKRKGSSAPRALCDFVVSTA
jgi:hypothetical protein